MALFNSSNTILKERTYDGTIFQGIDVAESMTVKGTANKFGIMFVMMMATTWFSWDQFYKGHDPRPMLLISVFGGLALVLIMNFKKEWSSYIAPGYALLEGLFVGSISAYYDFAYGTKYPGLVMQAVTLTLIVALVMFLVFRFRIIRVTEKFKAVILIATACIAFFYLAKWIVYLVAGNTGFGAFTNASTPLGIGFSVFVVCLASLNLLINFDMIEKGVENKLPKYMEWFSATGLLITLVWLYLEILRLLSKLRSR